MAINLSYTTEVLQLVASEVIHLACPSIELVV